MAIFLRKNLWCQKRSFVLEVEEAAFELETFHAFNSYGIIQNSSTPSNEGLTSTYASIALQTSGDKLITRRT
ncbi:hypothetical protein EAG_12627 [Camponotus floridanus]|uniref:Uncharacterized protein n=1 Tax=Camponotus floridanus TaxID=104421 RepID=E2AJF6_CAMFO|nr:hypothetical protein EAG_12627 [Camponotus floridanus]